jgi:hypothetical protein
MTTACIGQDLHNQLDKRVADIIAQGHRKDDRERNPEERFQFLGLRLKPGSSQFLYPILPYSVYLHPVERPKETLELDSHAKFSLRKIQP